jgi:hypothetical protein
MDPSLFKGLNRYFLGMLRKNFVTASLHGDGLTEDLLYLNNHNACAVWYPASLHYGVISKIKGRRMEEENKK